MVFDCLINLIGYQWRSQVFYIQAVIISPITIE